ncbi:50S ribosomal protein L4 [Desulfoluna spongiiphila]|uniref:Large ribosomal subunit protein uL4 n=1 Tax=Desulfoluna spongiiphila TaxID=419481 RepID=A0A1G5IWU8_9BACT|nr:50S ribosomal protein L4 [Desulfoluna spongiiphila]SCY80201.1 LSU ribosomal protein L4P [Desulfoluna spongiiphila]VVS93306.1 50s ribosomal protein ul4 [Desulfoluna spongiiphila]
MAVVDVLNVTGDKVSQAELADDIFNVAVKGSVLHEVVKMQLANRRAGSASVTNRSDITGSTKKLYRQKGTGNARSGSVKSPLRRGGGVIFGPQPKSWAYKVPKKVRRLALKMALSSRLQGDNLMVVNTFGVDEIKTKTVVKALADLKVDNALIVTDAEDIKFELSSRNIKGIKVIRTEGLNVYDILKYNKLLLLESSIKGIEGRLSA